MELEELKIQQNKSYIFYLSSKQIKEKDYYKKKEIAKKLKTKIEEILEIIPEDTDMLIKLMFTDISLNQCEEAIKIGNKLLAKGIDTKDVLNGLAIAQEKSGNYREALIFLEQMTEREPDNEYIKSKIDRVKMKQNREKEHTEYMQSKEYKYKRIADLEREVRRLAEQEQEKIVTRRFKQKL